LRRKRHLELKIDSFVLQVSTPFFGLGQALPAEMFGEVERKKSIFQVLKSSFSRLGKVACRPALNPV
jgi:hypothetical protein